MAKVSPQLEALQSRAKALSQDIALTENSFTTVKSEKDLQGLQGLLSCQQEMEVSQGSTAREVSRLAGAVPVRHWPHLQGPRCCKPWHSVAGQAGIFQWSWDLPALPPSDSMGQARGQSLHQLPCANTQLPAPHSSSHWWGSDSAHRAGKPGSSVPFLCSLQRLALPTHCSPCTSILSSVPASQDAGESSLGSEGLDASRTFPAL